jgi:hypothetical protein
MTRDEWLTCCDPQRILKALRLRASRRKLRLFGLACCRWNEDRLDGKFCAAFDTEECYLDGLATKEETLAAARRALPKRLQVDVDWDTEGDAWTLAMSWAETAAWQERNPVPWWAGWLFGPCRPTSQEPCGLLRDLFGPWSFRANTAIAQGVLAWEGGIVKRLAEAAYRERGSPGGHLNCTFREKVTGQLS